MRPPRVERVLAFFREGDHREADPATLTAVVREAVADERARLAGGEAARSVAAIASAAEARLDGFSRASVPPVINATGVIVHTNLGRAPWPEAVIAAATAAAGDYLL